MTVRFRDDRQAWYCHFQIDGKRHAPACIHPDTGQPAKNRREAKRIEELLKARAVMLIGEAPTAAPYTVAKAFSAFATRKRAGGNWDNQRIYVRELVAQFGPDTPVRELDEQSVWDYIAWAREQPLMVYVGAGKKCTATDAEARAKLFRPATSGKKRADSTINRYLDCLRETLRIAYALRDGEGRPLVKGEMPKVPDLAEPEHLPRPITDADLDRIVVEAPLHLAEAVLLARLMGFRKGEIFGLTVDQVDLANKGIWLAAEETKAKRAEFVPASAEACELLRWLLGEARLRHTRHLITYRHSKDGAWRPIANPRRAWKTVLTKLGLAGQHVFHNTKASFVTAVGHVASDAVTQQLARHKDYRTPNAI